MQENLNKLSQDITITPTCPTLFYCNFYGYVDMVKRKDLSRQTTVQVENCVGVSHRYCRCDWRRINSAKSLEEKVRYVASEEHTGNGTAGSLGNW